MTNKFFKAKLAKEMHARKGYVRVYENIFIRIS